MDTYRDIPSLPIDGMNCHLNVHISFGSTARLYDQPLVSGSLFMSDSKHGLCSAPSMSGVLFYLFLFHYEI